MRVRQGLLQGHKIDLCSTAADFNQSYLLTLVNACRFVTLLCPTNAGRAVWHDKLMKNASLSEQLLKVAVVQQNFFLFSCISFQFLNISSVLKAFEGNFLKKTLGNNIAFIHKFSNSAVTVSWNLVQVIQ